MRQLFVAFNDLDPDGIAEILSIGELWCRNSSANQSSLQHLASKGVLHASPGEVSSFSETASLRSVLHDILLHYGPEKASGPFSGPLEMIKVMGVPFELFSTELLDDFGLVAHLDGDQAVLSSEIRKP